MHVRRKIAGNWEPWQKIALAATTLFPATFPITGDGASIVNQYPRCISVRSDMNSELFAADSGYGDAYIDVNSGDNMCFHTPDGCSFQFSNGAQNAGLLFQFGDPVFASMVISGSDIAFGNLRLRGVANATAPDQAVNLGQLNAKIQIVIDDSAAQTASNQNPSVLYLVPKSSSTSGSVWFAGQKIIGP